MFLNLASYDGKTLLITTGSGPALIGHYMSSAEWRVTSALLASIASCLPGAITGVISAGRVLEKIEDTNAGQRVAQWRRLSQEWMRDSERGGFVVSEGGNVVFLPSHRDAIEDCVYRSFSECECFISPITCRRMAYSGDSLEAALRENASVEVVGDYSDISVIIHEPAIRDIVVDRVSRVVAYFNQF